MLTKKLKPVPKSSLSLHHSTPSTHENHKHCITLTTTKLISNYSIDFNLIYNRSRSISN